LVFKGAIALSNRPFAKVEITPLNPPLISYALVTSFLTILKALLNKVFKIERRAAALTNDHRDSFKTLNHWQTNQLGKQV